MGIFEIKAAKDGQFFFRLRAANGETILSSELYNAKAGATNGIESVKKNAAAAERFETKTSNSGKPYFVLKAGNHEIIGTSEMYESAAACENGIASVRTNAPTASVNDLTAT